MPQIVLDRRYLPPALHRGVEAFDRRVDAALDHWRGHPAADRVFYGASALGDHSFVWLVLGAWRGLRSPRNGHDRAAAVRVAAGLGVESFLVNLGIKSLFQRRRPAFEGERPLPLRQPRTSSFPSGHATSAFTAAGLLAEHDASWPVYYALALVVATSRAYVRIHHASDVAVGIVVGVALGRAIRRLSPLPAPATS